MYKPLADSTLLHMTKKELIELLRTAEHNAEVSQEWVAQQAENLKDWVPVVHGRWEYNPPTINTYGRLRCSICNWWTLDPSVDRLYSYCPNCGAKMDGAE